MYVCMYVCMYVSIYLAVCSPQCSPQTRLFIQSSITRKHTCTLDGNAHMEKAATKREIDKPGQLLAQGFKLACSVDRVGVQARATACSPVQR